MASPYPEVVALQSRIFAANLKVSAVMRHAGLRPATWSAWANGVAPNLANLRKVSDAIDSLTNSKD
jgi:hypothetical protein